MIQKIRVYVDGNGAGDGVQQIYGVAYSQMNELPGKIIPLCSEHSDRYKSGQDLMGGVPIFESSEFTRDRSAKLEEEEGGVEGGVLDWYICSHGAGIIRIYGHNMKGRANLLLRKNLKVVDNYLLTAPPIQFPINEVVDFRPSLYTETAGLSVRLLQMLLDVAKLRLRLNQLLLAVTQAESEAKQNR